MKEVLDGAYYANLVRMLRTARRTLSACLVEGGDDDKVFSAMFDKDQCEITVVHGWKNAVDALAILEKSRVPGVLAIIDADSGHCERRDPHSPNLFWTDNHDLELDMVHSPAFVRVVKEFCDYPQKQHSPEKIRQQLLEATAPLGYLRLHSEREKLYLTFKGLTYSDFIDKDTLAVDRVRMVRAVKNRSQRPDLDDRELVAAVEAIEQQSLDLKLVCRGHDFTAIFSLGLRKYFAKRQPQEVHPDRIEENLRSAFHFTHFQQTKLHNAIREWERCNPPYVVLRAA